MIMFSFFSIVNITIPSFNCKEKSYTWRTFFT